MTALTAVGLVYSQLANSIIQKEEENKVRVIYIGTFFSQGSSQGQGRQRLHHCVLLLLHRRRPPALLLELCAQVGLILKTLITFIFQKVC